MDHGYAENEDQSRRWIQCTSCTKHYKKNQQQKHYNLNKLNQQENRQSFQSRYNALSISKHEKRNIQNIYIKGISKKVAIPAKQICKIVTCTCYEINHCYYRRECRFLYYMPLAKTIESNHIKNHIQNHPSNIHFSSISTN